MIQLRKLLFLTLFINFSCSWFNSATPRESGEFTITELIERKPTWKSSAEKMRLPMRLEWRSNFELKIFLGFWCHDSKREIPKLMKLIEECHIPESNIQFVAMTRDKLEPADDIAHYNIFYTPTIILFKDGVEVERFVEYPKTNWYDDLNAHLKQVKGEE